jgi:hypothetical protein
MEWKYAKVDLDNDITTISANPVLFKGYYVHTALSAQVCPIEDGTEGIFEIPASKAADSLFQLDEPLRFETSLIIDPDNSATGKVVVFYRDLAGDI